MFQLVRYLKPFKKQVILGPIFKLLEAILELIVPLVMARIIDVGVQNRDVSYVLKMGGLMVLLGIIGLCCALVCQYFAARASQGVGTLMRNDLFSHINRLSHAQIDEVGTSSLITRVTNDVNQLQVAVAMLIRLVVRAPFLVLGAAVMAMILDLKLSLIFLAAVPLIVLTLYLTMSKTAPFYRTIQKKLDRISLITRENLEGVRVIRAFSRQKAEKERFDEASDDLAGSAIRVGRVSALLNPLTYVIMNGAIVAILWFGGMQVNNGELMQGQIIAFVNYMTQILLALVVVANLVVLFTKAAASAARVNEIFAMTPGLSDKGNTLKAPAEGAPKIEFKDVCFSYLGEDGEEALSHVSLKILPGQTIGIIGGTGSGKSTFVNLIPRFYEATKGEVLVDGVNVKKYPFEQLRGMTGVVPQQAVLFKGTVRSNLLWSNPDADEQTLLKALKTAQALDFVEKLPQGLDTPVVQGGKNFSGGQKQRLTIARALAGNPDILILDDSASALDFATDAALRRAIREHTEGMTVLIVSQRANTVKRADQIVVLDDGEVAGIGTHQELFDTCEVYREICLSQLSKEEAAK